MACDMFSYRSWRVINGFLLVSFLMCDRWFPMVSIDENHSRLIESVNVSNEKARRWLTVKQILKYPLKCRLQTADRSSKTFFLRFSINTKCNLSKWPDDSFTKHWASPIFAVWYSRGYSVWIFLDRDVSLGLWYLYPILDHTQLHFATLF